MDYIEGYDEDRWFVSSWQQCSTTCGVGVQNRQVKCKKQHRHGTVTNAANQLCTKDKPSSLRNCINKACHLKWTVWPWSKCFALCGVGTRRRVVSCPRKGKCSLWTRPKNTKPCYQGPCFEWATGGWGKCSAKCGRGFQRRIVKCRHVLTGMSSDKCMKGKRPSDVKQCKVKVCEKVPARRRCVSNKYNEKQCRAVLKFKLCHDKAWYSLCCKTCQRIAPPRL